MQRSKHKTARVTVRKLLTVLCLLVAVAGSLTSQPRRTSQTASIAIDARKIENRISPLLYGQFLEFMYEGIKGGLHAG